MKTLIKSSSCMLKACILTCFLCVPAIPVAAQTESIFEVPGLNSKKSIVRYWKGKQYIIYTEEGSVSCFSLVDYSSMACATFTAPSFLGVNDFEIAVDSVSNPVSGSLNSVVCEFDIAAGGAVAGAMAFYQPGISYLSLNQCDRYIGAVAVGGVTPVRLWHHLTGGHCVEMKDLPLDNMPLDEGTLGYYHYPVALKCAPAPVSGELKYYEIYKNCE